LFSATVFTFYVQLFILVTNVWMGIDDLPFLHNQEARNIEDFLVNFKNDPTVKIPLVYTKFSGSRVLVMEWIDGIRCTDPQVCRAHNNIFYLFLM
jgi:hypothetical protein